MKAMKVIDEFIKRDFIGSFVSLELRNEAKTIKGIKINKKQKFLLNLFKKVSYSDRMRKIDKSYKSKKRAWGIKLNNLPIIYHKGKLYLEGYIVKKYKPRYYLNDREISYEEVKPYLKKQNKSENRLNYININFDNITKLKMFGKEFS